jgi:Transcription activator MBF2
MKFIVKFLLIITAVVSSQCKTMSWGSLQARNLLMFDQFFHERLISADNCEVIYKGLEFSSKYNELITAIHVTDLTFSQDGGHVMIISGGIGYTFVKLQLISEINKQLLLNIEIFGRYID